MQRWREKVLGRLAAKRWFTTCMGQRLPILVSVQLPTLLSNMLPIRLGRNKMIPNKIYLIIISKLRDRQGNQVFYFLRHMVTSISTSLLLFPLYSRPSTSNLSFFLFYLISWCSKRRANEAQDEGNERQRGRLEPSAQRNPRHSSRSGRHWNGRGGAPSAKPSTSAA